MMKWLFQTLAIDRDWKTVFLVVEPRSILHSNKIVYLQVNCFKGHNEIMIEH